MAVQINEKTWPVAVACLGGGFAALPFPQVEGAYVVINTPDQHSSRLPYQRVRTSYGSRDGLSLGNIWLLEDDFLAMYEYDGRKNIESSFVDVKKVADPPIKRDVSDELGDALRKANAAYFGEQPDTDN
jgi:hypothetical protein